MPDLNEVIVWRNDFAPYSETFIYDEIRHHQRYRVTVFAARRINADRFPYNDVVALNGKGWRNLFEQIGFLLTGRAFRFHDALKRGHFRLIHAHFGTAGVLALPYAERFKLPLITSFHGKDFSRLFGPLSWLPWNWYYKSQARRLLKQSSLILAASSELQEQLIRAGCQPEKVQVFRLGVDLAAYQRSRKQESHVHIVLIGRLVKKKGFHYALRAIARQPSVNKCRVTIVGTGPQLFWLKRLARRLGLAAAVRFVGPLRHHEIAELLGDADIILAPSVVTAWGDRDSGILVVKEAAACEVPCVGSRHGGIPEIIENGKTGFLVPEGDVDALADKLQVLIDEPSLRAELGRAAREKIVREYDINERNLALEKLYDRVKRDN